MALTALEFIRKWQHTALTERQACQQHFLDLCEMLGHPKPAEMDPAGESFTFERGAEKQEGGQGWADVWKKGFFGWEYKGPHANLAKAYNQLLQYREALENPPLLVVCDMDRIEIHTNFTGTKTDVHNLPLTSLDTPRSQEILRALFFAPDKLKPGATSAAITTKAAAHIGELAQRLRDRGEDPAAVARFLDRIVFCLFAEDIAYLPEALFSRLLEKTKRDPSRFQKMVTELFAAMATGGDFGMDTIRHFNGTLFMDSPVLALDEDELAILAQTASLDWSAVDPSIFGTLFERGLDPGKRAQLGAHYTSREDIEAIVEPVVFAPLRREWAEVKAAALGVLAPLDRKSAKGPTPQAAKKVREKASTVVGAFLLKLHSLTVLDPACGSGNFLYVTLQKLKDLEKEVGLWAMNQGLGLFLPLVHPRQLYGIEINPYAYDLAQMTVWIGYLQWIKANGFGTPSDPILEPLAGNFQNKDAILDWTPSERHPEASLTKGSDTSCHPEASLAKGSVTSRHPEASLAQGSVTSRHPEAALAKGSRGGISDTVSASSASETLQGAPYEGAFRATDRGPVVSIAGPAESPAEIPPGHNPEEALGMTAREPSWPDVDCIVSNPPFLGDKLMRRQLGDEYVDKLRALYAGRIPGQSDLCCYWFERARAEIERGRCRRAGLLATQGIRGGANRKVLERIKETGDIFFAESDRQWILDGANVHVSMVGFDDGEEKKKLLDGRPISVISANLSEKADITQSTKQTSNQDISFIGISTHGPFDLSQDAATKFLKIGGNPNQAPNSDVIRPYMNGQDITQRPEGRWVIAFPPTASFQEAAFYEGPFQYLTVIVKPLRDSNHRAVYREKWWIHGEGRPALLNAVKPLARYIGTPRVSKHRLFVWINPEIITSDAAVVFARSDDYFFGVLHSRFHEVWSRAQATQLREAESGTRYTPTTCFETFPFPEPTEAQKEAIAEAAKELNALREAWLNPPEWTKEEILEFPGSMDGPWARYIARPSSHSEASLAKDSSGGISMAGPAESPVEILPGSSVEGTLRMTDKAAIGTVRYPRLVPKDESCAAQLKKRTLTNLYNQRPAWLALAHQKLDEAVAAAYAWPADLSNEAILEKLLTINLARSGREQRL